MTTETYIEQAERCRQQLSRLAASFMRDDSTVDDVVQESLLRLWLMRDRIDSGQDFTALAVRITKNVCISLWRQEQKMHVVPLEALNAVEYSWQPADVENREGAQILERAVGQLPPAQRRVFLLWRQGLGIQEIAAIIGATPRTVSSTLSLVRRKLYEQLKAERYISTKR